MVSMSPNTLHYNFTNKWKNIDDCVRFDNLTSPLQIPNNMYDMISNDSTLKKTLEMIKKGHLEKHFKSGSFTLFVTTDDKIPDSFIESLDYYNSRKFILAHTIKAKGSIEQLIDRGTTVYESSQIGCPILASINRKSSNDGIRRIQQPTTHFTGEIVINKVGKVIKQLQSSTGNIIIMNNIANILLL
jgi:hypothetical protein